ncbi:MAG: YkgJ family cysteine cluster protein [Bacteroidetes bacterium]|nr:YkgJ family cysteine cluster protein [Bacteroidota bacterium]
MTTNKTPQNHQCRPNCGACCIAPSISSPIPDMPEGKPANTRCIQLTDNLLCKLFGKENRPKVCQNFKFDTLICGENQEDAMRIMNELE